jgi:biotin operon repressor
MSKEIKNRVRDLRNGSWYWIHRRTLKEYSKKAGATGILVYNFLASLADKTQACFPSQKYIAESLGYSRATVNRAIKTLEKIGPTYPLLFKKLSNLITFPQTLPAAESAKNPPGSRWKDISSPSLFKNSRMMPPGR